MVKVESDQRVKVDFLNAEHSAWVNTSSKFSNGENIVTNAHLISRAWKIDVLLKNGIRREAEIVFWDSETDIAMIRIPSIPNLTFPHDILPRRTTLHFPSAR